MRVVDLVEFRSRDTHTFEQLNRLKFDIGNLVPGSFVPLTGEIVDISRENQAYHIFFTARNGTWIQRIEAFKSHEGTFDYNTEIKRFDGQNEELIYKELRDGESNPQIFSDNGNPLFSSND